MKYDLFSKGMAILLLMAVVISGCKKEEDPPPESQQLSFDAEEVLALIPEGLKNSDDPNAESCVDWIETAVDMSGFIDQMEVPDDAQRTSLKSAMGGDTWQWTWAYGGESYTFYWSYEEKNSKRYWTMDIQYGSGPRYNYIDAWETMDGKEGEVIYNYGWFVIAGGEQLEDGDFVYWKYTWKQNASGGYELTYLWDSDDPEYDIMTQYDVNINADGSGSIEQYYMDQLFYMMQWDVLGNGSWSMYSDGQVFASGSWVAG